MNKKFFGNDFTKLSDDELQNVAGGFGPEKLDKHCFGCSYFNEAERTCNRGIENTGLCEIYDERMKNYK